VNPTNAELLATILFGMAVLHTFSVKRFEHLATKFPEGSVGENTFHLLGEVEVVFGLWAGIFIVGLALIDHWHTAVEYLEGHLHGYSVNYTEPAFVFVIMTLAATKPILMLANRIISMIARILPLPDSLSFFCVALIMGPLLGSFITEPAAMTVTALILLDNYYEAGISNRLKYMTLGVLFVNVSIGGTLTHFAAPPVLMVAGKWNWDIVFMITHFGWKSAIAVVLNTSLLAFVFRKEILSIDRTASSVSQDHPTEMKPPIWLVVIHVLFIGAVVFTAHHMTVFLGIFLFFLGMVTVTGEYQEPLKLKEGLLVGFFLAGLVTLGGFQRWWLEPVITNLNEVPLFLGATGLTAITDNAALTYLGSLVEGISDASKYSLVAGAVAGGGLTVIANAPNPAGYGILKASFGEEGISPLGLLLAAIVPTVIAMICLWFLPNLA
jgi:Putative Na+/H+ antiporter